MFLRALAAALAAVMVHSVSLATRQAAAGAVLPPTTALHQALEALATGDRSQQQLIVSPFLGQAATTALSTEEELALGELHFLALDPVAADAIFEKHLSRTDRLGRMAWIRHQQMVFRAFDRVDQAEADIAVFRSRFPVVPEDLVYSSQMVGNQAGRYAAAGNHAKVVDLILEDLKGLPLDVPMRAFLLPGTHAASFVATGRIEEVRAILTTHRDRLKEVVKQAGEPLEAASVLKRRPIAHQPGLLHAEWDTGVLDDAPDFSRARFNAQMALDRIKQLESRPSPPKAPGP